MTAAKSTRTAIPRCRSAPVSAAIRAAREARSRARAAPGFENFNFGNGETADLSDLFEGLFGGGSARGGPGGGFRQRARAPQKGADVAYRLRVPFSDAVALKPQRITLADGKTIDLKLPQGVEDGTKIRLAGKGQEGPGGRGDAIVTIEVEPHAFFKREGSNIRLDLPVTLNEAVLGGKVKVPTPEGPVMLTVPKGTTSGKVLRLKGRGFSGRTASAATSWSMSRSRAGERSRAAEVRRKLGRRRQPAGKPWRLAPPMRDFSPASPESRRKRLASMRAAFGTDVEEKLKPRLTAWEVIKRVAVGVYNDGFIHAGNLAYLSIVALFPFFIVAAAVAHLLGQSQDATSDRHQRPSPAAARRRGDAARAGQRGADRAHRHSAVVRRDRRAVDRDQLRRDDPRHPAPRLWREILRAVLGISAGLDPADPRRGAAADDRLRGERGADHRPSFASSPGFRSRRTRRTTLGIYRLVPAATLFFTFYGCSSR